MSFLSVVVATYNREKVLRRTLEHLADQTLSPDRYEVIVVDDGSPDTTEAMVTAYAANSRYPLKYLRHQNRGPGYSENRGIREARGPWVLLIADDIHPLPQMLEAHYRAHEQHPEPQAAVAGKVIQSPDLPDNVFHRNWDPFRYKAFENLSELTYLNFWACNVSFKKDFFLQHGGFIERFGAAHEDTEVGWRLYRNGGMRLLYCKEALAHHYHIENIETACKRAYERGLNFDVLTDSVDDPALYIRTHIVTWRTLRHYLGGYKGFHGDVLTEDRNIPWVLLRHVIRVIGFNRATIPVYRRIIRSAENHPLLARLVSPMLIRGTVSYHFLVGLRELQRRRRADAPNSAPLPI